MAAKRKTRKGKAATRRLPRAELERRIHLARAELAAGLFFLVPPNNRLPTRRSQLTYSLHNVIKNYARLIESLGNGDFQEEPCAGCDKPIRPGQEVVRATEPDFITFHADCYGPDAHHFSTREPTIAEQNREITKRVSAAREYLKRKGAVI